jgi:hypothetical protein
MSEPSKQAFAEAARVIPCCPDCRDNGDDPPRIDPGCCVWCDRALDQVARAIDAARRAALLEAARIVCMHRASTNVERPRVANQCCKLGWDIRALIGTAGGGAT